MEGGASMGKRVKVCIKSSARTTSNGNIRIRTTINNGHSTKTISKTIHVR